MAKAAAKVVNVAKTRKQARKAATSHAHLAVATGLAMGAAAAVTAAAALSATGAAAAAKPNARGFPVVSRKSPGKRARPSKKTVKK